MRHPSCDHPTANADDFSGVICCICDDNPCPAVTVEHMRDHRGWDIAFWSEAAHVAPF